MTIAPLPLMNNHCFASLHPDGNALDHGPAIQGIFLHDTRHIAHYDIQLKDFALTGSVDKSRNFDRYLGRFSDHAQQIKAVRNFMLGTSGFLDAITLTNETDEAKQVEISLIVTADFRDLFELRGRERMTIGRKEPEQHGSFWTYTAQDGVVSTTRITFTGWTGADLISLPPRSQKTVSVKAEFTSSLSVEADIVPQANWNKDACIHRDNSPAHVQQAYADIDMLLMTGPGGVYPAAGIPNFVTLFGRDSLLTASMLLDSAPDIAAGTLRALASVQGEKHDPVTREAPGKIPHEIRIGELNRTGDIPFGRYYGTSDASALFVMLIRDYAKMIDPAIANELAPNWRGALKWCREDRTEDGFLRYPAAEQGRGLLNNSWKDSDDSMSYADGTLAKGRLAVIEVQGYLAAALDAGADLEEMIDGVGDTLRSEAHDLREQIDAKFWNGDLGLPVIALDDDSEQLAVASSNPGHLLWAGAVSSERAAQIAERLMSNDIWTGWGLRTLALGEQRYRPLSYHNGSIWPHDTGLFAVGLARYGLWDHFATVCEGLSSLAEILPDQRLPELVGGYQRDATPPLPYFETCNPQAWAAAALIALETIRDRQGQIALKRTA